MADKKQHWRKKQSEDYYYQQAKAQGFRSRAAFKLIEINKKYRLIKPGHKVLDLGAAPGGWSQVVKQIVGNHGLVVAIDRLDMKPLQGVEFIKEDLTSPDLDSRLTNIVGQDEKFDLIISDMAPNISGIKSVDQNKSMYLVELSLDYAENWLKLGGAMIIKLFHGAGFEEFMRTMRILFKKVIVFKPKSSSVISREVYCLGTSYTI